MSRTREVVGSDEHGRPKGRWTEAEPVTTPYGFMEPAIPPTIERRKATDEEMAAARAREAEPEHLTRPSLGTPPLIVGRLHEPEEEKGVPEPPSERPDTTAMLLPTLVLPDCAGCVHAVVCSIRPRLDDPARWAMPAFAYEIEPGIHVRQTMALECDHYMAAAGGPAPRRNAQEPRSECLTARQSKAIDLMLGGKTRAEVAREMGTTYQTVDGLLEAALKKGLLPKVLVPLLPARFAGLVERFT